MDEFQSSNETISFLYKEKAKTVSINEQCESSYPGTQVEIEKIPNDRQIIEKT